MSSVEQVAINSRAVRAGADRLENAGYQGCRADQIAVDEETA